MRWLAGGMLGLLAAVSIAGCNFSSSTDTAAETSADGDVATSFIEDVKRLGPGEHWSDEPSPAALGLTGEGHLAAYGGERDMRRVADPYFLVGESLEPWQTQEWANSQPLTLDDLRGRVVVVRFWTDGCEYCVRSMPALQQLADEFSGQPVTFIGMYHSKGTFLERDWDVAVKTADAWGVTFPITYDRQWRTLNNWWRSRLNHLPTSVTFVIGPDGRIAHIHPGPVYYPTDNPVEQLCDDDYQALRLAIRRSLSDHLAERK